jgi:hypothetical protein
MGERREDNKCAKVINEMKERMILPVAFNES